MSDYTADIQGTYAAIAEAGGVVTFKKPPVNSIPADPEAPWEGNSDDPEDYPHVAVLLPLAAQPMNAASNHRILIPAFNLPFEIQLDQRFIDDSGRNFSITAVTMLAPDPTQVILFDCECALWPAT